MRSGPAADVGGVGHPVAGGQPLPLDGDADVDAEHARQDGGGQVGGELEQGNGTSLAAVDADVAESLAEPGGADRLAGPAAGEQPGGGAVVAEGGVTAADCRYLQGEGVDGLGKNDGLAAEPDEGLPS